MTPRAYYGLVDRHRIDRRHMLYCACVTASAIYNVNRGAKSPVIKPEDMIGGSAGGTVGNGKQSGADMLMLIRGVMNPMFNGTEAPKTNE